MSPNDSATCTMPLLTESPDALLDSEVNSDVIFLVGQKGEASRVPAHRSVLSAASPVFRTMLEGALADGPVISIPDVERRAFDQLLRYCYREKVHLQSVETALLTLYAAHKYQCEGLERNCISYVASQLSPSCVLAIYHDMLFYCNSGVASSSLQDGNWSPSAPTLEAVEANGEYSASHSQSFVVPVHTKTVFKDASNTSTYYESLLKKCLQYIDHHADEVLQQEQVEELSQKELYSIVQRETLGVSSERVLFRVLEKWCSCKCKSNKWELSVEKRRFALGIELLFSVRYLLMTSEEFINGPMRSNLLNKTEIAILLGNILKHSEIQRPPPYLEELLPTLRRPRHRPLPMIGELGSASAASYRNGEDASSAQRGPFGCGKRTKKMKKQKIREERNSEERKLGFTDYFVGCVACIFD